MPWVRNQGCIGFCSVDKWETSLLAQFIQNLPEERSVHEILLGRELGGILGVGSVDFFLYVLTIKSCP